MPEEVIPEVPKDEVMMPAEKAEKEPLPASVPESEGKGALETSPEKVEGKYTELLAKVTPTRTVTTDDDEGAIVLDAKHIGQMTDEESKVQHLLDLAHTKGVVYAVKVARTLQDYYALDRVHDELSNKLYQGLLEKGLIEKEEPNK